MTPIIASAESDKPRELPDNLSIWHELCHPPDSALRPITGGRLKGKTDIDPMWRWMALTERFGPCGVGWRYEVFERWTEPGDAGQVMAFVAVDLYFKTDGPEGWGGPVRGFGGAMLVAAEQGGLHSNDEGFKMALTDALGTAAKMIGLAADVYMGRMDGSKYPAAPGPVQSPRQAPSPAEAEPGSFDEVPLHHTGRGQHEPAPQPEPGQPRGPALPGTDWKGYQPANPDNPACPVCKGQMWDNREPERGGKAKGKLNPRGPDFACRNKCSKEGVYWPAKAGGHKPRQSARPAEAVRDGWPDEQPAS